MKATVPVELTGSGRTDNAGPVDSSASALGHPKEAPVLRQRAVALQLVIGDVDQGAIDIAEDQFGWHGQRGGGVGNDTKEKVASQKKSILSCGPGLGNLARVHEVKVFNSFG